MKSVRIASILTLAALLASSLAACGAPAAPSESQPPSAPAASEAPAAEAPAEPAAPASGGALVIAMNLNDVVTLDPAYAGETTNLFIHINTYDTLVDIRPDDLSVVVPRLAESWEVNDDFSEFIFHLRKDVKFASGNP
ncbi:MAG: ABC transporter substrate-binding protein, partial [Chloroflexi bacterium]|nr:ABC transporter substrate-binding protein [Chloroflexota bacterium]